MCGACVFSFFYHNLKLCDGYTRVLYYMYCNDTYVPPAIDRSYDIELIYIRFIDDDNIIAMINGHIAKTCVYY